MKVINNSIYSQLTSFEKSNTLKRKMRNGRLGHSGQKKNSRVSFFRLNTFSGEVLLDVIEIEPRKKNAVSLVYVSKI